jgi:threonine dehydratase
VSDDALREGMYLLFSRMKLAVEPAGAATTAGLVGPLAARLAGKRTGLIVCGANIDPGTFTTNVTRGAELWAERRSSS